MLAMMVLRLAVAAMLLPIRCNAVSLRLARSGVRRSISKEQLTEFGHLAFAAGNHSEVDPVVVMQNLEQQLTAGAKGDGDGDAENPDKVAQVLDQMAGTVNASHNASVEQAEDLIKAFSHCNVNHDSQKADLAQSKATVGSKADAHTTCREAEEPLFNQKTTCRNELQTLQHTKDAVCGAVDSMKDDPGSAADVCHSQGEEYGAWLVRNWKYFEEKAKNFQKAEEACANATKQVNEKTPICNDLDTDFAAKKNECDEIQEQLESATCSYGVEYGVSCTALSMCWTNALTAYNSAKSSIASGVVSRKATWRAIKRMSCLVKTFAESDQNEAIDICINKTHNTSHLDITLAPPPQEPTCEVDEPLPCSAEFKAKHYAILPANAQAKPECSQCSISGADEQEWVLVMKIAGSENVLHYDDPLWTNDELLNADSAHCGPGTAKYERYLNTPFAEMKICVGGMHENCIEANFGTKLISSAKELFSGPFMAQNIPTNEFTSAFEAGGACASLGVNMGFNSQCANGVKARFGYCAADSSDCSPCMVRSAIGVGLCNAKLGASFYNWEGGCVGPSAGYGALFSDTFQESPKQVWIWVKGASDQPVTPPINLEPINLEPINLEPINLEPIKQNGGWTLIGKLSSNGNAGYDDPYWTTDEPLHANEPGPAVPVANVKYPAWANTSFSHIRVCAKNYDFGTNMQLTDMGGCAEYWLPKVYHGATEFFTSGPILTPVQGTDQAERWEKVFGIEPLASTCPPSEFYGINIDCGNGGSGSKNFKVRIGHCERCAGPCHLAPDGSSSVGGGAIGIGLQDAKAATGYTDNIGAGASFGYSCENPNAPTHLDNVWLWVY